MTKSVCRAGASGQAGGGGTMLPVTRPANPCVPNPLPQGPQGPHLSMPEPIVVFEQVSKTFGTLGVLDDVNWAISRGECVALAGLNGAGKTTLIKCLLDLCQPSRGRITVFGRPHSDPMCRKELAFLPERFVPPHHLRGRDFLRYSAQLRGMRYEDSAAGPVLDTLDLDRAALERPIRQLSKGMVQKLGLAATFLAERSLLLLDEPMSGLDPQARACLERQLRAAKAAGRTVLFTTHALAGIDSFCDRILILHRGVPYFAGTPQQLCHDFDASNVEEAFLHCVRARGHERAEQTKPFDRR
jgi:ABC-2 type transport system ATP-binding protein